MKIEVLLKSKRGMEFDTLRNKLRIERAINRSIKTTEGLPVNQKTADQVKRGVERVLGHAIILGWIKHGFVNHE